MVLLCKYKVSWVFVLSVAGSSLIRDFLFGQDDSLSIEKRTNEYTTPEYGGTSHCNGGDKNCYPQCFDHRG